MRNAAAPRKAAQRVHPRSLILLVLILKSFLHSKEKKDGRREKLTCSANEVEKEMEIGLFVWTVIATGRDGNVFFPFFGE